MIAFDDAHRAVHAPADRRFRIWIRPRILAGAGLALAVLLAAAWIEALVWGEPRLAPIAANAGADPIHGFPGWLRACHFLNFLFMTLLLRSGLSILMDHPRLYFNDGCAPGTEWMRLTPIAVPRDRLWTAKDDARYLTPLVGTPGYRHTVGIARVWHFISVHGFLLTGVAFFALLFATGQWHRLAPGSWSVIPQAWGTLVHYLTFQLPPEPDGFYAYNALQQLAYFGIVFVCGPLALATGLAMSPAVVNRFPWYARLFGGRQSARSIHFLNMAAFALFLVAHVTMVVVTGFARNMNHIVLGTDDTRPLGWILGLAGIATVALTWVAAHYLSWRHPRGLQRTLKRVTYPMQVLTLNKLQPRQRYTQADVSPYFWPNGKMPVREDWKRMAENGFAGYRLKIGGLVERPTELSLAELEYLGGGEHITMHHCIQGWSGIAQWGGIPMAALVAHVRPKPEARVAVFYSFGEALYGGTYYDTQRLDNLLKPESLLAWRMNGAALPPVYGAPLRLRVENQLGYKMVKWIERIEFVASEKAVGLGEGGKNEDDEYFDLLPNI
jgi:sulfoxide reductase catalytic subunit YedY